MAKPITAEELDRMVDEGKDITEYLIEDSVCQPGKATESRNDAMPNPPSDTSANE